jgi:hypothetical protein
METVPEPVPDSATINGRGGGAHPDAETQHGARRASETHTARRRQETHGVEDNPGYSNPPNATGGADEGYFEVGVEPGTTCVLCFFCLVLSLFLHLPSSSHLLVRDES